MFFWASVIPMFIVSLLLFYLIFSVTADQMAFPEAIAYNLLPAARRVLAILAALAPLSIVLVLMISYNLTLQMVGPFDRIVRELDQCLKGEKKTPIVIRENDKFWPLVHKINDLIKKQGV